MNTRAPSFGPQIRARRMQMQLSLTELARRSGLSIPFLSQLERGHTGISLESLQQLARGLEVSLNFFVPQSSNPCPVRSPREFQQFWLGNSDVTYAHIGSRDAECRLEALLIVLPPKSGEEVLKHQGEAFLMVLQGSLSLCLGGHKHLLEMGYTAHLKAGTPYTWSNPTEHEVRLSWVGTPKIF